MHPVKKTEDGSFLVDVDENSGAHLLAVIPPEVEEYGVVGATPGTPKFPLMHVRACGGVRRFRTRAGREAIEILPGEDCVLIYGLVESPQDRGRWWDSVRNPTGAFEFDGTARNKRGSAVWVLRVVIVDKIDPCPNQGKEDENTYPHLCHYRCGATVENGAHPRTGGWARG